MPTHALLGATGGTGSAILRALLHDPQADIRLNILVRSKSKLLSAFPELETTAPFPVKITEGPISSVSVMKTCIRNADVIHMCIATNVPTSKNRVAQDTAETVVTALRGLREELGGEFQAPTILVLRSGALNKEFIEHMPYVVHNLLFWTLYYVYHDLELACQYYESVADGSGKTLLHFIHVDPPGLHESGSTLTGYELLTDGTTKQPAQNLSYADLGAAFVEIAARRKEFSGQAVMVSATGHVEQHWLPLIGNFIAGLRANVFG